MDLPHALAPVAGALGHILAAIAVYLLNHVSVAMIVAAVVYLYRLANAYGPRVVASTIATANTVLQLHLDAARQAQLVALVGHAVYAAQTRFALPQDRRDAVVRAVAAAFPGADAGRLDTLIDAAIAAAKLQHGPEAWGALAPTVAQAAVTPAVPQPDLEALRAEARAQGHAAGVAEERARVANLLQPGTVAVATEIPVSNDGSTGAPVNVAADGPSEPQPQPAAL